MNEVLTQPKFITVRSVNDRGVHLAVPVDFILSVAPLFKHSEILDQADPVKGITLIKLKNMSGLEVYDTLADVLKAINAVQVTSGELQITPEKVVLPVEIDLSAVMKK